MMIVVSRMLVPCSLSLLLVSCSNNGNAIPAGPEFQKRAQEALIQAKPGDIIQFPEGKLDVDRTLSLTVPNVTIRGKGMDKTILSFKNQKSGSAGLLVTAGGFTLEDVGIEDTKGDGVKVNGVDGVTFRRVRTEWTGGPNEKNGSYGLYPVQCKNVLIEDSVVRGAADAGIYVGQSKNIIVRRNRVELNVAGIEIENSSTADAYENIATKNTGGMLVFNLPDLPVKSGRDTRFFNNQVYANNTENFAPKGNMVANVPTGTGVIVLAASHVEVFKNTIRDNNSANVSIISYYTTGNPMKDASYDPFNHAINVHDNTITGGGTAPAGRMATTLGTRVAKPLPSILFDGIVDPKSKGEEAQICIQNNGDASFMNYDAAHEFKNISRDVSAHACSLPALAGVSIPVVAKAGVGGGN